MESGSFGQMGLVGWEEDEEVVFLLYQGKDKAWKVSFSSLVLIHKSTFTLSLFPSPKPHLLPVGE